MSYFDMHCHFLPGIDDGAQSNEESLEMLSVSYQQGITSIAATPHYYPKETVVSFLERREKSYNGLMEFIDKSSVKVPDIIVGSEVAYYNGITNEAKLDKLCYSDSRYLLLELPFSKWSPKVLKDIYMIRNVMGLTPVIAHLDRYIKYQSKSMIEELMDMDVRIQINADAVLSFTKWLKVKKWFKDGRIACLGSDSHNLEDRAPNLGLAIETLHKRKMDEVIDDTCYFGSKLFRS